MSSTKKLAQKIIDSAPECKLICETHIAQLDKQIRLMNLALIASVIAIGIFCIHNSILTASIAVLSLIPIFLI